MDQTCTVGLYSERLPFWSAVRLLEDQGFTDEQVSLVSRHNPEALYDEPGLDTGDRSATRAAGGAGLGGLVGLLVSAPLLTVPGIGPLLIAGSLASVATGSIVGGFLGALAGWGVDSGRIEAYEEELRQGRRLLIVHGDPATTARARQILEGTEADELHYYAATSSDDPGIDDRPGQ